MPRSSLPSPPCGFLALAAAFAAGGTAALVLRTLAPATAQEGPDWHQGLPQQYKSRWLVHDLRRPKPPLVRPGEEAGAPPSDAIVLFDGTSLESWTQPDGKPARWVVRDGTMEVNATGSIRTKEEFGDCQLHLEWRAPVPPKGVSQLRGNSGIFFMGRYEVQVLDNHGNETYADGYAASVYGQHPPLANACRPPGEWQVYDIVFRAPRFKNGKLEEPARVTAFHNGACVQHNAEVFGSTVWRQLARYQPHGPKGPIVLQDHGDRQPVRFRNIWVRSLDLSGAQ